MKKNILALTLIITSTVMIFCEDYQDMNLTKIKNVVQICAGGLIAIESSLLLFGMNYPSVSDWSSIKNITFALSDIILGSSLIYYSLSKNDIPIGIIYLTYGLLLSTHIYRDLELIPILSANRFCQNTPLYILNNVRIGLLATGIGLSFTINY